MRGIYRATYAVPELGIEAGDMVVVEPGHPRAPLKIIRAFDRNDLPSVLDCLNDFPLLRLDEPHRPGATPHPQDRTNPARPWLRVVE